MIGDLIRCYVNARRINRIYVISNFYDEKNLISLGKDIKKIQLSEHEIDCLLTYYSICEFIDRFYVISFHKMGRRIPQEFCEELSKFEMAAAGILKMKKSEMERRHE